MNKKIVKRNFLLKFRLIMLLIMNVYGSLFESFLFKILKCDKFVEILLGIDIGLCFFEMK